MNRFQRFVLLALLIVVGSCNKEKTPPATSDALENIQQVSPNFYKATTPIESVTGSGLSAVVQSDGGVSDRGGESYYFTTIDGGEPSPVLSPPPGPQPTYPYYNGQCKFIFRSYASQNCGNCAFPYATVRFRNGILGPILASYNVSLGQGWVELNVPQTCAVSIEIGCAGLDEGPKDRGADACQYKIQIGEYGWEKGGIGGWTPTNVEVYYLIGRYQPKGAPNTYYSQYLCDDWCTWNAQFNVGQANPSPADYSFECAYQTYGASGSTIKRYNHITQAANSTLNRLVYPLQINSVYQVNNTANSPTTELNTQLSCTLTGGIPTPNVTVGWGTAPRISCYNNCTVLFVE